MYPKFAVTSNVKRYLAGINTLERRGSPEASWMVAIGDPGLGKSRTLIWWSVREEDDERRPVYLRAKTNWTPHWMLSELANELRIEAKGGTPALFDLVFGSLAVTRKPLVIDEARNMLHDKRLFETIRDLTDSLETPFILGGEDFVLRHVETRFPQISSRITTTVRFEAASAADVRTCCDELSEVPIADDLAAEIHRQSKGFYREIKNAIAAVEAVGKRIKGKTVSLDDVKGQPLCRPRHPTGR